LIHRAARLIVGGALAWLVALAVVSPLMAPAAAIATMAMFAIALWRPAVAIVLLAAITPAGQLLAPDPARAAEMLAWAFLAGWLLRIWRPLSPAGFPRIVLIAASLYAACVFVSWLAVTLGNAGGIDPAALPRFVLRAIGTDHLAATSPEPQTWTMLLALGGVAVLLAAIAVVREQPSLARWIAGAIAIAMAALSLAVFGSVLRQWAAAGFAWMWLARYPTIERAAIHLLDVNAAGSQYVLGGLAAFGLAIADTRRRWLWSAVVVAIIPGIWISGSRSAALTAVIVAGWAFRRSTWKATRAQVTVVAAMIVLLAAGAVLVSQMAIAQNAAGQAMRFRMQFTQTTARMFATAPMFGVGVGRYHQRSGEFMPAELRAVFVHENAHNYFAQQFAELGLVGGLAFLGLVAAALRAGWRSTRAGGIAGPALMASVVGYLVTCVTGHPLLVSEAAIPFWVVFGASAAATDTTQVWRYAKWLPATTAAVLILLTVPLARAGVSYRSEQQAEQGFYPAEQADGMLFRWTTRHAVTYVPSPPGFLTFEVRAAGTADGRPFELQTEVDGILMDRRTVPADRWMKIEIPIRPRRKATAAFRRVDLRLDHTWSRQHRDGARLVSDAVGVMVAGIKWEGAK
jgi:O-antigen ligase